MMLVLLTLSACKSETAAPNEATAAVQAAIQVVHVEATTFTPTEELTGSLEPIASVQLGFDVPGRIEKLFVHRGDRVQKGQAIAQLDARMAAGQLDQAAAQISGAEAQLAAGEAGWTRMQTLHEAGSVSQQQYQEAEGQIKSARAGIAQAKAGLKLAQTYLSNHTLRAPIDGIVTNGPDNAGAMIGAGNPLFLIEDLSSLRVKANAPETATWIKEGLDAVVLSGIPGDPTVYPAKVTRVIPALDPATRRIPVEVEIPAPATLRAHGYARVRVSADTPVDAWTMPRAALVARPEFCVYVQEGTTYKKVLVDVLSDADDKVVVRASLAAGAQVVLNPPNGLDEVAK